MEKKETSTAQKYSWVQYLLIPLFMAIYPMVEGTVKELYGQSKQATVEDVKHYFNQQLDSISNHFNEKTRLFNADLDDLHEAIILVRQKEGSQMFAVSLRVDQSGKLFYRTTENKIFPAYWRDQYKWYTYIDTDDGREYGVYYEKNLSLNQLKNRASIIFPTNPMNPINF